MIIVLIPVYNERNCIEELLTRLRESLKGEQYKLFFIDDGSKDGTTEFLQQHENSDDVLLLVRQKIRKGCVRGKALYDGLNIGVQKYDPEFFIEIDGDLSHMPEEIPSVLTELRRGSDVVIVSKYLADSKIVGRSKFRNNISWINSFLFRFSINPSVTDYSNGFRGYNRKAAQVVITHCIRNDGPIYLGEVLAIWLKSKMNVKEVAGTYRGRGEGSSKVVFTDLANGFFSSLRIIFQFHFTGFPFKK